MKSYRRKTPSWIAGGFDHYMKNKYQEGAHFFNYPGENIGRGRVKGLFPLQTEIPLSYIASILAGKSNLSGGVR